MKDKIKLWKEKTKGLFNIVEWTRFWNYITNLQEENEDLKITKAGQHASIEILKEENGSLKGIAELRKDTLIMNQKKVDKLQERIEKAIKLLKEAGCYEEDTKIFCTDIYHELPELLNILTGGDDNEI